MIRLLRCLLLMIAMGVGALSEAQTGNPQNLAPPPSLHRFGQRQIRDLCTSADVLIGKVRSNVEGLHLRERWILARELWSIRESVNLAALVTPSTLNQLTGLDVQWLQNTRDQIDGALHELGIR